MPIIVAAATMLSYSALASSRRDAWLTAFAVALVILALAVAIGFCIGSRRPWLASALLHAWTPMAVGLVAIAVAGSLIIAFNLNVLHGLDGAARATGAAGVVGGLATIGGLLVESSRRVVASHRTPWLAQRRMRWLVGDTADSRADDNTELWDRLYGASRPDRLWSFRGIRKTLELVRGVRAARAP